MTESLAMLVVFAALTEAITTNIAWLYADGWEPKRIIALAVSMLVTALLGFDIFQVVGVTLAVPYAHVIGVLVTGFLGARGANVLNDLAQIAFTRRQAPGISEAALAPKES